MSSSEEPATKQNSAVEDGETQSQPEQQLAPEVGSDPDEDDLSDLDDVLDEFATTKLDEGRPAPLSSGPGRPVVTAAAVATSSGSASAQPPGGGSQADDDEFAHQLQAGMADLLGELETSPDMQSQFEEFLRELGRATDATPGGDPDITATKDEGAGGVSDASFQETIRRTMERMQSSGQAADAAAASSSSEMDFMTSLLRDMESGAGGTDEDFSKMLLGMMEQLTNKEILYEPMKELHDKFPDWMEKNQDKVPVPDMARYKEQQRLVAEIVAKFEINDYSDEHVEYREYIVERMQQMQAAGSPPSDLVGDMNAAQEALGELDAGCPQQ